MNTEQLIHLNVAELIIAEESVVISTILGSCVSVCLYCPQSRMGGMNHFALPSEQYARTKTDLLGRELRDEMYFGSTSIPFLIEEFFKVTKNSCTAIQAKIVGGASVVEKLKQSSDIGALNVAIAEKILREYGIPIVGSDIGGIVGRKIHFYTGTGRLRVAPVGDKAGKATKNVSTKHGLDLGLEKPSLLKNTQAQNSLACNTTKIQATVQKRVLIVDDSKTIRNLLTKILNQDPLLKVVGVASDAIEAETMISRLRPDVITLDIHMPKMDGVTFLEKLLPRMPLPVVMITSLNIEDSSSVLRALELGAVDYIQKPQLEELTLLGPLMCERIRTAASARVKRSCKRTTKEVRSVHRTSSINSSIVVAIGASTGGTEALKDVLVNLPEKIPPIVIVQHIPAVFSLAFANRLNELCPFKVKEAADGDQLKPGCVLIAPGGKQMAIVPCSSGYKIRITDAPPVNRHKPSVDYLFDSIATHVGKKAIGILLTGMGNDGAKGLLKMKQAGARTIGQDEESCVVYGMPKVAFEIGAVEEVHPLNTIPTVLVKWLSP
ncbi:MAG: chemotaxis-specific protein-glutamate methyltransferase CheB [Oligoflexia bacterium]|nr:chemotaxis-specific protein-glutamate methyltransferase CheB [Oligoflexia bacterium]